VVDVHQEEPSDEFHVEGRQGGRKPKMLAGTAGRGTAGGTHPTSVWNGRGGCEKGPLELEASEQVVAS
jgi:hypothetical protein